MIVTYSSGTYIGYSCDTQYGCNWGQEQWIPFAAVQILGWFSNAKRCQRSVINIIPDNLDRCAFAVIEIVISDRPCNRSRIDTQVAAKRTRRRSKPISNADVVGNNGVV